MIGGELKAAVGVLIGGEPTAAAGTPIGCGLVGVLEILGMRLPVLWPDKDGRGRGSDDPEACAVVGAVAVCLGMREGGSWLT